MSQRFPDSAAAGVAFYEALAASDGLPLSEAVIASDDLDRAQRLYFADEDVARRVDELVHLAERLGELEQQPLHLESTPEQEALRQDLVTVERHREKLLNELADATEGVIAADEVESLVNAYVVSKRLTGDPAKTAEIGPFSPWPAESTPRRRRQGLAESTIEMVVKVWLKVLGGMTVEGANQAVAKEHRYVFSTLRKYRQELRERKADLRR